jgi:hypothetical protein
VPNALSHASSEPQLCGILGVHSEHPGVTLTCELPVVPSQLKSTGILPSCSNKIITTNTILYQIEFLKEEAES